MANYIHLNSIIIFLHFLFCISSISFAQNSIQLPLKAVSLGNWLVIEGWMRPSLFDAIPNNDLLDGTQVQLKSTKLQNYICAENGGGAIVVANRSSAAGWETFRLWRINETSFNFRVFNKNFLGLENQGKQITVVAISNEPSETETFQIIRNENNPNRIRIRASNGLFLQAKSETLVTADYASVTTIWDDNDPSVFEMTILSRIQGEYQISNGYDPKRATQVLQNHRETYITEDDFRFMSSNGLDAVRIPIGWWIVHDPTPPKPFVAGSLRALDNAFQWAQNHGMKVIVDLHAVQSSQNGEVHSGTRDGYQEWGSDSTIQDTLNVIDFIASRYGNHPSLAAIELMNEPMSPGVTLDSLIKYYQMGYDTVRRYTSSAYVILSNRLGPADPTELLAFASNLSNVVVDVHFYNLFSSSYRTMTVQQNIDFIYNRRSSDLRAVTSPNGPLSFVGEWCGEFEVQGSKEDYQRFAKAQIDVYGNATFGWAYWAYKCDENRWSLRWMIENGYITL